MFLPDTNTQNIYVRDDGYVVYFRWEGSAVVAALLHWLHYGNGASHCIA